MVNRLAGLAKKLYQTLPNGNSGKLKSEAPKDPYSDEALDLRIKENNYWDFARQLIQERKLEVLEKLMAKIKEPEIFLQEFIKEHGPVEGTVIAEAYGQYDLAGELCERAKRPDIAIKYYEMANLPEEVKRLEKKLERQEKQNEFNTTTLKEFKKEEKTIEQIIHMERALSKIRLNRNYQELEAVHAEDMISHIYNPNIDPNPENLEDMKKGLIETIVLKYAGLCERVEGYEKEQRVIENIESAIHSIPNDLKTAKKLLTEHFSRLRELTAKQLKKEILKNKKENLRTQHNKKSSDYNFSELLEEEFAQNTRQELLYSAQDSEEFSNIYDSYKKALEKTMKEKDPQARKNEFFSHFLEPFKKESFDERTTGDQVIQSLKKEWYLSAYLLFTHNNDPKTNEDGSPLTLKQLFRTE